MGIRGGMSRRQVFRIGTVVAGGVGVIAVADAATADPGGGAGKTGKRAELGRVVGGQSSQLLVTTPDTPNHSRVNSTMLIPYAGFPDHVVPRTGDLVTVIEDWPGLALAAVPVCHWITGAPKAQSNGSYLVAGTSLAASPLLADSVGKRIQVCVLDTELPTAQVLATRAG